MEKIIILSMSKPLYDAISDLEAECLRISTGPIDEEKQKALAHKFKELTKKCKAYLIEAEEEIN